MLPFKRTLRISEMCRSYAALAKRVLMAECYRPATEARRIQLLQMEKTQK